MSKWNVHLLVMVAAALAAVAAKAPDNDSDPTDSQAWERQCLRLLCRDCHERPASINEVDKRSKLTPLQGAALIGYKEEIALLLARGAKPDIFTAAALGETERLARMLKDNPKLAVSADNDRSMTALHFAVAGRQQKAAEMLLNAKANPNASAGVDGDADEGATPLFYAVDNDDLGMAELLLARGADLFLRKEDGQTLLHGAAFSPRPAMAAWLLAHKLDVNAKDKSEETPLHTAAFCGNTKVIELLLDHGADINGPEHAEHTPIHEAARQEHLEAAELLRKRGARLDFITAVRMGRAEDAAAFLKRDPKKLDWCDRAWPLEEAIKAGNLATVRMLLDAGAKVDGSFADANGFGTTPLHIAAVYGRRDAAELLLDRGAKVNVVDNRDVPLTTAAQNGHADVVRLLLKRGADLSRYGGQALMDAAVYGHKEAAEVLLAELRAKGRPALLDGPLYMAALNGRRGVVEFLLAQGADVRSRTPNGDTPLHAAARDQARSVVALLLDKGADVTAASSAGTTPLHECCGQWHRTTADAVAVAKELLGRGAAVNVADNDGDTPLHVAAGRADAELVQLLLDHKADATAQNKAGKLPWQLADAEGQDEIAGLLRRAAGK